MVAKSVYSLHPSFSRNFPQNGCREEFYLATREDLLTVMGMSVPAGRYVVFPAKDPRNNSWTLKMRNESAGVEPRELPPVANAGH